MDKLRWRRKIHLFHPQFAIAIVNYVLKSSVLFHFVLFISDDRNSIHKFHLKKNGILTISHYIQKTKPFARNINSKMKFTYFKSFQRIIIQFSINLKMSKIIEWGTLQTASFTSSQQIPLHSIYMFDSKHTWRECLETQIPWH